MRRKKIAVFANSSEIYLNLLIDGIKACADKNKADLFLFLANAYGNGRYENDYGEYNIFNLARKEDFDGALIFSNLIYIDDVREQLKACILNRGIENVTFLDAMGNMDYIGSDNYNGMRELAEHLVNVHGIKSAVFLGGPKENLESRKRLNAVRDVLNEHGYTLPESSIFYGDWHYFMASRLAQKIIDGFHPLPDAIICANDASALAVCAKLNENGYKVPDDVIVTGFDHVPLAQSYYPSITSVERGWVQMGTMCCQRLIDKIDGRPVPAKAYCPSHLAVEESCGCPTLDRQDRIRRDFSNAAVNRQSGTRQFEWELSDIEAVLNEAADMDDLPDAAGKYYATHHQMVGSDLAIVLDKSFRESVKTEDNILQTVGYRDDMEVLLYARDGKSAEYSDFTHLYPDYENEGGENHCYLFLPMHHSSFTFGYLVLKDNLKALKSGMLNNAVSRFNEEMDRFRRDKKIEEMNRQLIDLYTRDPLTGLYNRYGFGQIAARMMQKNRREGKNTVLFFSDINRMKMINDQFGHLQGDLAIRTVADVIRNTVPPDWPVCRFGGDEIIILGTCEGEQGAADEVALITEKLAEKTVRMSLPYSLTTSFGYCVITPDTKGTTESFISEADARMYENKQKCHDGETGSGRTGIIE
jgi:diguanylate cyclase (GGDEF)-like protein